MSVGGMTGNDRVGAAEGLPPSLPSRQDAALHLDRGSPRALAAPHDSLRGEGKI